MFKWINNLNLIMHQKEHSINRTWFCMQFHKTTWGSKLTWTKEFLVQTELHLLIPQIFIQTIKATNLQCSKEEDNKQHITRTEEKTTKTQPIKQLWAMDQLRLHSFSTMVTKTKEIGQLLVTIKIDLLATQTKSTQMMKGLCVVPE